MASDPTPVFLVDTYPECPRTSSIVLTRAPRSPFTASRGSSEATSARETINTKRRSPAHNLFWPEGFPQSMANPSDDLDELLDSALDDFGKLDLGSSQRALEDGEGNDENLKVHGLGLGLPNPRRKKKGKQKVSSDTHVAEALEKLTQQTREAVRGLEIPTTAPEVSIKEGMMDDFVKQFEELAGTQDMESIVETMMQQLLSKEILHEPMKEIGERYPKWLEEHKSGLSKEDYQRYCHQHELIIELNGVYENDADNFPKIVDLMQKMQECGQPPSDIVQELAPDLDLANLGSQLPLDSATSNCCIM